MPGFCSSSGQKSVFYKVSVDVFYCIVTTEEDHHSVVETFGEKKDKFFVEPPG